MTENENILTHTHMVMSHDMPLFQALSQEAHRQKSHATNLLVGRGP
jgi:hypothetical protein